MAGEPIDELAIRLTADGADFLEETNKAIDEAVENMQRVPDEAQKMSDSLTQATQDITELANDLGISIQDAAHQWEGLAIAQGHSADEIIAASDRMRRKTAEDVAAAFENAMNRMIAAAERFGKKIDPETLAKLEALAAHVRDVSKTNEDAVKRLNKLAEGVAGPFENLQGPIEGLAGQVKGLVGGMIGAVSLYTAFNLIKGVIKESIPIAQEYQQALLQLNAAVNASREVNGEAAGTMREWVKFAQDLSDELGKPFTQTMVAISANVQMMSRDLGLSKDQIQNMITITAKWALVNGRELGPSLTQITRFVNTGWSNSLASLGVIINDTTLQHAALELGIHKTFNQMTTAEKEAVRYQAVMDSLGPAADQAADALDTMAGRQNKANENFNKAKLIIGNFILPAYVMLQEYAGKAALAAVEAGLSIMLIVSKMAANIRANFAGMAAAAAEGWHQIWHPGDRDPAKITEAFNKAFDETQDKWREITQKFLGDLNQFKDGLAGGASEADKRAAQIAEALAAAAPAIDKAMQDWADGVAKADQKISDKLDDIQTKLTDKLIDLRTRLDRDLVDIDRNSANKRIDAIHKFNTQEVRLREDHQRRLKELERKYLFDLEDAVRERDARRVLNLQRAYNMQRQKENEDFKLAEKRRRQDFKNELADIERQRREARQLRQEQYKEQVADAHLAAERQRRDAQLAYQRQLRDLRTQIDRQLREQARGIQAQLNLNGDGLDALYQQLLAAYGPNGWVEAFYQRYAQIIASAGGYTAATPGHNFGSIYPGRQRGGTFTAMGPGLVPVGEGRPEQVTVTPLSAGDGRPSAGFRQGGEGGKLQLQVDVQADDKLMVEVTDHVSNEVADVVAKVTRTNSRQGGITGR